MGVRVRVEKLGLERASRMKVRRGARVMGLGYNLSCRTFGQKVSNLVLKVG